MTNPARSIGGEANERLRAIVRELLRARFEENISAFARALGVTGPYLNEFLSGKRGAGAKLLHALADYTGRTLDDLSGRSAARAIAPPVDGVALAGNLPHWSVAAAAARALRVVPDEAIDAAAHIGGLTPPTGGVTPEFVIDLAQFVARYGMHRPEVRAAAARELRAVDRARRRLESLESAPRAARPRRK